MDKTLCHGAGCREAEPAGTQSLTSRSRTVGGEPSSGALRTEPSHEAALAYQPRRKEEKAEGSRWATLGRAGKSRR